MYPGWGGGAHIRFVVTYKLTQDTLLYSSIASLEDIKSVYTLCIWEPPLTT